MDRDDARVLADGPAPLPPVPAPDGRAVVLAAWRAGDHGAVLRMSWQPDLEFRMSTTLLARRGDGWEQLSAGGSGGGWYPCVDEETGVWRRLDEDPGEIWICWCDDTTYGIDAGNLRLLTGFAVPALAALVVDSSVFGRRVVEPHPVTGALLLGVAGEETVRLTALDAAGAPLRGPFGPVVLPDLTVEPPPLPWFGLDGLVPCARHSSHVGEIRSVFRPEAFAATGVPDSPEAALGLHLEERPSSTLRFARAVTEPRTVTFHGCSDDGVVHAVVTTEQVGGPHRWLVSFARACDW